MEKSLRLYGFPFFLLLDYEKRTYRTKQLCNRKCNNIDDSRHLSHSTIASNWEKRGNFYTPELAHTKRIYPPETDRPARWRIDINQ